MRILPSTRLITSHLYIRHAPARRSIFSTTKRFYYKSSSYEPSGWKYVFGGVTVVNVMIFYAWQKALEPGHIQLRNFVVKNFLGLKRNLDQSMNTSYKLD